MPGISKKDRVAPERTLEVFEKLGNVRATATELGISRDTVLQKLRRLGKRKKPLARGTVHGVRTQKAELPTRGVKRYILTSAQNNTYVHDKVWDSLVALAMFYDAEVLVGTFSYDQNRYGQLSVKRGKSKVKQTELWYDPKLTDYINDDRRELGKGLVWCGEMNILPTAVNPLAGLESYTQRQSAIFPHAKMAMRSIPTMQGEGTKLNYTTGTVTQRNYIQKREGLIAEHHHIYGGLLVEVNEAGNWWVRQLNAENDGTVQDLSILVKDGKISEDGTVEAITWGDLHAACSDQSIVELSQSMLDALKPKYQFMHDVLEGSAVNHHVKKDPYVKFYTSLRSLCSVTNELGTTAATIELYDRSGTQTIVVESNHDDPWIKRWMREFNPEDPSNIEFFTDAQKFLLSQIRSGKMPRDVNMLEWGLRTVGYQNKAKFLSADESFMICNKKIECGMHGHLGPNGRMGSPDNLAKMGRKANTAHTHSAGIYSGLYVAGTSSKLRWDYAQGPSSWSHSHIVTYPSGKRTIITMYAGKWRA